jgi:fructose-1,6-bisphosphatase/inositol monophosphatase family enzyme
MVRRVNDESLLEVLVAASEAVWEALDSFDRWKEHGDRPGQYRLDLVADAAACRVLHRAGLAVLSEESGASAPTSVSEPGLLVVLDPVDGSTNASHGLPWFATSLCVLDDEGPRVSLVVNQASGVRYLARRGGGAHRDGRVIAPSGCREPGTAVVGVSGTPDPGRRWWQFRALGSAALDLCAVAEGVLDGYSVVGGSSLFGWDYLGALLVCTEAGAVVGEHGGLDLVVRDRSTRRPAAAATPELLADLLADAR